jgi:hypothetical protein
MKRKLALSAALGFIALLSAAALPVKGWTLLGERLVTDRADHDVITVTSARGSFRQIKLTVNRHAVDFSKVVVHFGNGGDQTLAMRSTIPAGGETRAIDLEGTNRFIRSVEFWYDAKSRGGQAFVRLYCKD